MPEDDGVRVPRNPEGPDMGAMYGCVEVVQILAQCSPDPASSLDHTIVETCQALVKRLPIRVSRDNERADSDASAIEAMARGLSDIFAHFAERDQAPGHSHRIPGIWDQDISNGALGGTACEWCQQWNDARAALAAYRKEQVAL